MTNGGFSKLTWLKRTNGHESTGAEFRVLIAVFNHSGADGSSSHPGLKLLTAETGYGKSAVSDALTALQQKGWITQTFKGSGVSGRTSVYNLVPEAPSCTAGADQPDSVGSTAGADQLPEVGPVERTSWSAGAVTVVPLERSPTDPDIRSGSDPSLSDPEEKVRYSPDQEEDQHESPSCGGSLAVEGSEATTEEPDSSSQPSGAASHTSTASSRTAAWEDYSPEESDSDLYASTEDEGHRPEGLVSAVASIAGSSWDDDEARDDPFSEASLKQQAFLAADRLAREERATVGGTPDSPWFDN